jgi:hypothetical protein
MDEVVERLGRNVYITFDVDCFDPSLVPSTGTPEPGGLQWYPVLRLLRRVFAATTVRAVDVVELAPTPGLHCSGFPGGEADLQDDRLPVRLRVSPGAVVASVGVGLTEGVAGEEGVEVQGIGDG